MSKPAIIVKDLGKRFQIGQRAQYAPSFRDAAVDAFKAPWRRFRSLSGKESEKETFWALKDVSFETQRGDVVGIIGRNGAGKSTMLKILSRILEPTEGEVRMRGRASSLLEVGTGFHPDLTGRENTYLNGAILGMKRAEINQKFDDIVAFAEVEKFLDTPVKYYSSGMYVRLAFAVAAHLEPEILIVDEVLAVGDAAFQKKCLGRMGNVARQGRTVLFVSHNMAAVKSLCRRAIWIDQGRIRMDGPAGEVVDTYLRTLTSSPECSFDLSAMKREGHNGSQFKITGVTLNRNEPVCHGQPVHMRLEFETYSDVVDVSVGIGFASFEGVRIVTLDTDLQSQDRPTIRAGTRGAVEVTLDYLDLQPGTYVLDVGARSGDRFALDYLGGCGQVEVMAGPGTPTSIMRADGGVRLRGQWKWC